MPATISPAARATAHDAAVPDATARTDPADRSHEKDGATLPVADTGGKAQAAPAQQPDDPATLLSTMPASAIAVPRPASAATVVRKAIAGMLGFKPSMPAGAAPDATASAGLAVTDGTPSHHAHVAADAPATTDDGSPDTDTDATANAIAPPGPSSAVVVPSSPTTVVADSAVHRPPAANISAQLGEHHIALAQGDSWLDQLARDISSTAAPDGKLHFQLNPERLGSLHVEVARGAEGAAVRMTTQSSATRDILVDAQPQLAAQAQAQGVRIAGTHVDLGAGTGGQGGGQQPNRGSPQVRALGMAAAPATTDTAGPRPAASERYA